VQGFTYRVAVVGGQVVQQHHRQLRPEESLQQKYAVDTEMTTRDQA
jgi:hypothetical protein